ncbi:precorrin-3B C(17)-methyltransferase [Acidiferrimicrobium sp. IK]|uniref:precorrin-3B C(17)-methyltransferase n=1 Tax=Acidiferrimicrobium sp. IK TaxID=2871700 RepID=UPI0021CB9008|nr:precorrin-3B C(17)-methyltransferase [Acidiferrimicrobium sp. IK]MCU4186274.1 precorrin-3B C(17)-methyltransferase [Acidiferrimicrobium sp. IK]
MTGPAGGSGGQPVGQVWVVGLGPGASEWRTPEVDSILRRASDLVGYQTYLDMVAPGPAGQRRHASDNREEAARAAAALDLAAAGRTVAVVSSGDPGVFAMAAAVMEQLARDDAPPGWAAVEVTVTPGITAAQGAAARAGAPLGHDFAVVSLSDNLKPWATVERRLDAAAGADFVLALYNPVSRHRPWQLGRALDIISGHRDDSTPVVVGRDVGRPAEEVGIVALGELDQARVDMRTVLVIGSSTTAMIERPGHPRQVYTPRSYPAR